MSDLPGWIWAPGQWAQLPNGRSVLVMGTEDSGRLLVHEPGGKYRYVGLLVESAIPDPDGVGMGEWALKQAHPYRVVSNPVEPVEATGWVALAQRTVGEPIETFQGANLYAACEAVARAQGGWNR